MAAVGCQIKPMEVVDVTPHNWVVNEYLQTAEWSNYGCRTQIRRSFLRNDGFHINPRYASVLDKTYACAILGEHVPSPTPDDDFFPEFARRRYEKDWPGLAGSDDSRGQRGGGGGPVIVHGWSW